jgi:hypothetical protein
MHAGGFKPSVSTPSFAPTAFKPSTSTYKPTSSTPSSFAPAVMSTRPPMIRPTRYGGGEQRSRSCLG